MIPPALKSGIPPFPIDLSLGLLWVILILNLISFFLYYSDKQRAKKKRLRIREKYLLRSAWLLGGVGAWLGMKFFRHKTLHARFKYGVPIAALLTLTAIYLFITQL